MTVTKEHLEVIQNRISTLEHYVSMIVEEIKAINGRAAAAASSSSSSGPRQQVATRPLTDQEKEEIRQHQQRQAQEQRQMVVNGSDDDLWPIRKLPPMPIEQYQELLETEMYPGLALVVQNG